MPEPQAQSPEAPPPESPQGVKRLNINLPSSRFSRLQDLSKRTGVSMTTLVRWGIGVVESVVEDLEAGKKIVILDGEGRTVKELIIPL
ncbi:MAG: hypothetical protein GY856_52175 [bacterium]|nr:hypothetical protein [bacterium]